MDTTIKVTHSTVYGVDRFYPENKLAEALLGAFNQKTFTREQLKDLHLAGFTVEVLTKPISFK